MSEYLQVNKTIIKNIVQTRSTLKASRRNIMSNFLAFFAFLGMFIFFYGVIRLIVSLVKKMPKKIPSITMLIGFALFISSAMLLGSYENRTDDKKANNNSSQVSKQNDSSKKSSLSEENKKALEDALKAAKEKAAQEAITEKAAKENTGWDEGSKTFTTGDGIFKIDRVEKTADYSGKTAIKLYFTLTNKRSEIQNTQLLFQSLTRIQQKSVNTSNDVKYAIMPFGDKEEDHLRDNINPEGTVSGFYPLELENETDPIIISFQKYYKTVATYEIALN